MKYHAYTTFEYITSDSVAVLALAPRDGATIGPATVKVPANGANRVQFLALPIDRLANYNEEAAKESGLFPFAARINGVLLLPAFFHSKSIVDPSGNRFLAPHVTGERLDFCQSHPAVEDHTLYELTFPDPAGQLVGAIVAVMVIRTFISLLP